jgi:hypothetical protein
MLETNKQTKKKKKKKVDDIPSKMGAAAKSRTILIAASKSSMYWPCFKILSPVGIIFESSNPMVSQHSVVNVLSTD